MTDLDTWPGCTVPDCPNKANLGAGTGLCFPHHHYGTDAPPDLMLRPFAYRRAWFAANGFAPNHTPPGWHGPNQPDPPETD